MTIHPLELIEKIKQRGGKLIQQNPFEQMWEIGGRRFRISTVVRDVPHGLRDEIASLIRRIPSNPEADTASHKVEARNRVQARRGWLPHPVGEPGTVEVEEFPRVTLHPQPTAVQELDAPVSLAPVASTELEAPESIPIPPAQEERRMPAKKRPTPIAHGTTNGKWPKPLMDLLDESKKYVRVSGTHRLPFILEVLKRDPDKTWRVDELLTQLPKSLVEGKKIGSLISQVRKMSRRSPYLEMFKTGVYNYVRLAKGHRRLPKGAGVPEKKGRLRKVVEAALVPPSRAHITSGPIAPGNLSKAVNMQMDKVEKVMFDNTSTEVFIFEVGKLLGMLRQHA